MMIPNSKPYTTQDEIDATIAVLKRGDIAIGPEIEQFAKLIADFIGKKYGIAVTNGTAAIHMALMALEISTGDEVILPASVCPGVMHAIEYTGATPVLCDINASDLNLNYNDALRVISKNTKAIILPHLFGIPSNLNEFQTLNIPLIEDCAQSLGSAFNGHKLGSFGVLSTFSFYATKMCTSIDGGMILTDSKELAQRMKDLRYYGGKKEYKLRYNYKLQNVNAAIGIAQLKNIDNFIQERRQQFKNIFDVFKNRSGIEVLGQNIFQEGFVPYKALINFKSDEVKELFLNTCSENFINASKAIFVDLEMFRNNTSTTKFPNLKYHIENTYSFPIYPGIDQDVIRKFFSMLKNRFMTIKQK